jgi:hypothetical protein
MQEAPDNLEQTPVDELDIPRSPHPLAIVGVVLSLVGLLVLGSLAAFGLHADMTYPGLAAWGAPAALGALLSALGMFRPPRTLGALGLGLGACAIVFLALLMIDVYQTQVTLAAKIAQQRRVVATDPSPADSQPVKHADDPLLTKLVEHAPTTAADTVKSSVVIISGKNFITADDQDMSEQALNAYLRRLASEHRGATVTLRFNLARVDTNLLDRVMQACRTDGLDYTFDVPGH